MCQAGWTTSPYENVCVVGPDMAQLVMETMVTFAAGPPDVKVCAHALGMPIWFPS